MNEYIIFMHDDVLDSTIANDEARWGQYIEALQASGQFDGGSTIGQGTIFKKNCVTQAAPLTVTGYIRVRAENMGAAKQFLNGNPIFEAGGTPWKFENCRAHRASLRPYVHTASSQEQSSLKFIPAFLIFDNKLR